MAHVGLNTVCPVCGGTVPQSMPPMELEECRHLDGQGLPMVRVCGPECRQRVLFEPQRFYLAAKSNIQAESRKVP